MNVRLNTNDNKSALTSAIENRKKEGVGESISDAFNRIYEMKNTEPDLRKIKAVQDAMNDGLIGREQSSVEKGKKLTKAEVMRLYTQVQEVERKRLLEKMVEETPDNYELVTTEDHLQSAVNTLLESSIIVFDVETEGTDVWHDRIVGYVMSTIDSDKHYYIPTRHKTEESQLEHDLVTDKLRPTFELEDTLYIAHNAKFDLHMLDRNNVEVKGRLWDTMEAMRLLNENEDSYALKVLATKYLKIKSYKYGDLFGQVGFEEVSDLTTALSYAAKDGDLTYKLYDFQMKHLSKMPSVLEYITEVEMPLIKVIVEMEKTGFVIDEKYAEQYGKELNEEIEQLHSELNEVFVPLFKTIEPDKEFNVNSSTQLKKVLSKYTGKNLPNTDAKKTLKPLSKEFEIVRKLLRYKELVKLYSTYITTLPKKITEYDGKLHANFNQNGAATGRFSSGGGGINLQNQPDGARALFVAPEGKILVGADFKAQEIRCVAYLSEEPSLIHAFEVGQDPYATMASNFYNRPYEEVYKNEDGSDTKERKEMKVVWLATLYGMSVPSLAEMLGVDKNKAKDFQEDLFESMPKLKGWIDDTKNFAIKHGFVWLDNKQRKRRLPKAKERTYHIPYGKYYDDEFKKQRLHNSEVNRSLRQAPNAVVQGSSAIQTKVTLIKMYEECKKREGWRLWCTVHDELIVEVPEDITKEEVDVIRSVMVDGYPWGETVPNGTDLEFMYRWSEKYSEEDWFTRK
ncbi:DNA polymerase [Abyssicoccus albus]|uniref:DNA polymerase I n=1 Tax=Abyssicoccus albus TaxID=1817405 RepID=A0A3N5CCQ3_9BACL|nr:DNA polymerase [Abyssicoccus albus]RPF54771.1 DNA polymerase-1 [Abyssicoccus albus]